MTVRSVDIDGMIPKRKGWRRTLVALCIFVSIGALGGGLAGILWPDGSLMQAQGIITTLQAIPLFGTYIDSLTLPASALLLFVFAPQAVAAALLLSKRPKQYAAGMMCGILLVVFTVVEIIVIPNVLSWIYLAFGIVEVIAAALCWQS